MTRRTNFDPRWARRGEALVVVADGGRARILKREGKRYAPPLPQPIARAAFALPRILDSGSRRVGVSHACRC